MKRVLVSAVFGAAMLLAYATAFADSQAGKYHDTVQLFKNAGESASFFGNSYGYAVFPTIDKGGFVVGGAHGSGRVYEQGKYVGDVTTTQLSVGLQIGGQAYSEIIFFQDKNAFNKFTQGNFEFGADVSAVAITAAATGSAGTMGTTGGASGKKNDAATAGGYHDGIAVFTIVKGGAMGQAAVGGQKFSYKPRTGG
jgi:lipid-binding SYLF domain-containing protein